VIRLVFGGLVHAGSVTEFIDKDLSGARFEEVNLRGARFGSWSPGYPESMSFPVQRCLGCIVNEEWEHRLFAERDLAVLEERV